MVLGIGVDVVEVERMRNLLKRHPKLADRLFSESEKSYSRLHQDPSQRFAVRFAAKEAVMKALKTGFGSINWKDVEVVSNKSKAPDLKLSGRAAEHAREKGITSWHLSLTHSKETAMAFVVAAK